MRTGSTAVEGVPEGGGGHDTRHDDDGGGRSPPLLSRPVTVAVLALAGLGLVLRLAMVARPLSLIDRLFVPDDAYYMLAIARSLAEGLGPSADSGATLTTGFQPLIALLTVPVFWVTADPGIPLRAVLVLSAAADAVAVVLLARPRRPDRRPAGGTCRRRRVGRVAVRRGHLAQRVGVDPGAGLVVGPRRGVVPRPRAPRTAAVGRRRRARRAGPAGACRHGVAGRAARPAGAGLPPAPHLAAHGGHRLRRRPAVVGVLGGAEGLARPRERGGRCRSSWRSIAAWASRWPTASAWRSGASWAPRSPTFPPFRAALVDHPSRALVATAVLCLVLAAGAAWAGTRRRAGARQLPLFALGLHAVALVVFYGVVNALPWFFDRYLLPVAAVLGLALAALVGLLWSAGTAEGARSPAAAASPLAAVAALAGLAVVALPAVGSARLVGAPSGASVEGGYEGAKGYAETAREVLAQLPPEAVVASLQSGALGYFPEHAPQGVPVVNLDGVVDGDAARALARRRLPDHMHDAASPTSPTGPSTTSSLGSGSGAARVGGLRLDPVGAARPQAGERFGISSVSYPEAP